MAQSQLEDHDRLSLCHYLSLQATFRLLTNQVHELCLYPTVNLSATLLAFSYHVLTLIRRTSLPAQV